MTIDNRYYFPGYSRLSFGQKFEPQYRYNAAGPSKSWNTDKEAAKRQFQPPPGVYRARDLIAMFGPLLDTCIRRVGRERPEATRDVLIGGLAAILATSGRESSLALRNMGGGNPSRTEMVRQADTISATLLSYVHESLDPNHADPKFSMMSHCDGHLWTKDVVGELMGPRGDSVVMQLYNEWSHRIVLLRNALMPFENWDEVPIVIENNSAQKGMRMLERPSDAFVMRLLSGRLTQSSLVEMAKALTAPSLPSGGFGFQYSQGTILPAFLAGSPSRSLLRYYPAQEVESPSEVLFDYEHTSYEVAARSTLPLSTTEVSNSTAQSHASVLKSYPLPDSHGTKAHLKLQFQLQSHPETEFSVCFGQIARGRRYASRVPPNHINGEFGTTQPVFHSVENAFSLPGLVFSTEQAEEDEKSLQVFTISDPLIALALFGKLYPGNVVELEESGDLSSALHVGRGFGTKFVIWQKF